MALEFAPSAGAAYIEGRFADIGAVSTLRLASPVSGHISAIYVVREGTPGLSVLTITTSAGAMTRTLTMGANGAIGDVDSQEFSPEDVNNRVEAGSLISIASGGEGGAGGAHVLVVVEAS